MQIMRVHPLYMPLQSPAADAARFLARSVGLVTPGDTAVKYQEHAAAYADYQQVQQKYAGNIEGGSFIVRTPQDQQKFAELQGAAARVESTGQTFEQYKERELFGISRRVSDLNKGAADYLNLPAVPAEAEPYLRAVVPASLHATQYARGQVAPKPVHEFVSGAVLGGYERFRVEPLTAAGSVAVGFLGGAAMKGATLLPKVGPVVASKGPAVAKGVEALYAGSVALRTAGAGPDYFGMGREFGGIMTTEAVPMYAGVKAFTAASPVLRGAPGILRRSAPETPAGVRAGWYPENEMILDGLRMRAASGPVNPLTVSRYPKKGGQYVEVGPEQYVHKGGLDTYLRRFEVESPGRRPIPPEFLAREDILDVPAHWRPGGKPITEDVPQRRIAGGWYPENEMILEGLRMRAAGGPVSPQAVSRYPKKGGQYVEVGPEQYVHKGDLDTYLRRFEVESPGRRPVPPEFLAREDILDVPAHWRTRNEFYSGLPITLPRSVRRPHTSRSGSPSRIRPAHSGVRPRFEAGRFERFAGVPSTTAKTAQFEASHLQQGVEEVSTLGTTEITATENAQIVLPIAKTDLISDVVQLSVPRFASRLAPGSVRAPAELPLRFAFRSPFDAAPPYRHRRRVRRSVKTKKRTRSDWDEFGFWENLPVATAAEFLGISATKGKRDVKRG